MANQNESTTLPAATRTVTKIFTFEAAHRIVGHAGKCKCLHGHSYRAEVTLRSSVKGLDHLGMVVDFGIIKDHIGSWINENWDHNTILNRNDPLNLAGQLSSDILVGRVPFLIDGFQPTAEVLAEILYNVASHSFPEISPRIVVTNVRIYETPTSYADFSRCE